MYEYTQVIQVVLPGILYWVYILILLVLVWISILYFSHRVYCIYCIYCGTVYSILVQSIYTEVRTRTIYYTYRYRYSILPAVTERPAAYIPQHTAIATRNINMALPVLLLLLLPLFLLLQHPALDGADASFAACAKHFFRGKPPIGRHLAGLRQVCKPHVAVLHDDVRKVPAVVAFTLRFLRSKTLVPAEEDWRPDPDAPEDVQATDDDYTGSGYDRGHLAPAKTFSFSCEAESATYTWLNAAPQQPASNKHIWIRTERFLRQYLAAHPGHDVHVLVGTWFDPNTKRSKNIGEGVGVPDAYWTANWDASAKNADGTRGIGWGFVVKNTKPRKLKGGYPPPVLMTIKQVEAAISIETLFVGAGSFRAFFGADTTEAADPIDPDVWRSDLLRPWGGAELPPNTEPEAALPESLERCRAVCERLEEGLPNGAVDAATGATWCKDVFTGSTKEDRKMCARIAALEVVEGRPPAKLKQRRMDEDTLLLLELSLKLSRNCRDACKDITDPHANFFTAVSKKTGKRSSIKYFSPDLLIAEIKDGRETVMEAMQAATVLAPLDLAKFGKTLSEPVYGGLDKDRHLLAWPSCDLQLEGRKPVLEVDLGGSLLEAPVRFRGQFFVDSQPSGRKYFCAGFQLEGTKHVWGLFTGAKRIAVVCEKHSVNKWVEALEGIDTAAGASTDMLLQSVETTSLKLGSSWRRRRFL